MRVARSSQPAEQCVANAAAALAAVVDKVPKKWHGVQAVYLKTAESAALPIYQAAPGVALKIT